MGLWDYVEIVIYVVFDQRKEQVREWATALFYLIYYSSPAFIILIQQRYKLKFVGGQTWLVKKPS